MEQKREQKRKAILNAAKKHFLSDGFILVSMDKVAHEANLTKQTLYRYFSSKELLFKACLEEMGTDFNNSFVKHLEEENTRSALLGFAKDYIHFHLSKEHIAIFRLLVAEANKAPEILSFFQTTGPDDTSKKLASFFSSRLNIKKPALHVENWTNMLLSLRQNTLLGAKPPSKKQVSDYAEQVTDFLLASNKN